RTRYTKSKFYPLEPPGLPKPHPVAFRFFTLLACLCQNAGMAVLLMPIWSCSDQPQTLFKLVPASQSGIDFENTVVEKDTINILTVQYMYHGGGVAVGDFNNDGLTDVFFSGTWCRTDYTSTGGIFASKISQ